ncbi:MAG: alpha/beta fold hydrolase [Sideroxyarcus sp.]|nr:alpha/beta fold hydrolase [Sideroxyarcus sp.]
MLHPDRRQLQGYQQDWIRHPAAHGMQVKAGRCAGDKVPCLFVAPDRNAGPQERGRALRKQLAKANSALRPYGETQGILVLLHGRSGRKEDLLPIAERFVAAGFKCVIPDLPAHGDNKLDNALFATAPFERDLAARVLADARAYFNERDSPAGVWGISMGGAFAIKAVSQSTDTWKAAVIVSSFDSLEGVVEDKLAFLPGSLSALLRISLGIMTDVRGDLILKEVHPDVWAKRVTTPVLVAHGDRDQVISLKRGRRLFDSLPGKNKSWLLVSGATHRNVLTTSAPLYSGMSKWFIAHVR